MPVLKKRQGRTREEVPEPLPFNSNEDEDDFFEPVIPRHAWTHDRLESVSVAYERTGEPGVLEIMRALACGRRVTRREYDIVIALAHEVRPVAYEVAQAREGMSPVTLARENARLLRSPGVPAAVKAGRIDTEHKMAGRLGDKSDVVKGFETLERLVDKMRGASVSKTALLPAPLEAAGRFEASS